MISLGFFFFFSLFASYRSWPGCWSSLNPGTANGCREEKKKPQVKPECLESEDVVGQALWLYQPSSRQTRAKNGPLPLPSVTGWSLRSDSCWPPCPTHQASDSNEAECHLFLTSPEGPLGRLKPSFLTRTSGKGIPEQSAVGNHEEEGAGARNILQLCVKLQAHPWAEHVWD